MQPAYTDKANMFGSDAPIWTFLSKFGGAADPLHPAGETWVLETYPALTMISLGWLMEDPRPTGRLPKYNPLRRKNIFDLRLALRLLDGV